MNGCLQVQPLAFLQDIRRRHRMNSCRCNIGGGEFGGVCGHFLTCDECQDAGDFIVGKTMKRRHGTVVLAVSRCDGAVQSVKQDIDKIVMTGRSLCDRADAAENRGDFRNLTMTAVVAGAAFIGVFARGLSAIFPSVTDNEDRHHENGEKQGKSDGWVNSDHSVVVAFSEPFQQVRGLANRL